MSELILTQDNFDEVINGDKPVLVDFFATWCGPCQMMAPLIEELAEEQSDVVVCKVDVDEEEELAGRFHVMSIPTLMLFKDGELAAKNVGALSKEKLKEFIAK